MVELFDYAPRKIVQLIQLGAERTLLRMQALSLCVNCGLCAERCPAGIDVGALINSLRGRASDLGVPRSHKNIDAFDTVFLRAIFRQARVSEARLVLQYNLRTRQYLKDLNLGKTLLCRGKIRLPTWGPRDRKAVRCLFGREEQR
jgi:heterodisulfide reductase subunit C